MMSYDDRITDRAVGVMMRAYSKGAELRFKGDSKLSNFYECPVEYDGRTYGSSEAAYQSMKTKEKFLRDKFTRVTPAESKKLARKYPLRPDWEDVKYDIMVDILVAKYLQNRDCRQTLLDTGEATLIEDTTGWHDKIWGKCYCENCGGEGQNLLGKALMTVREKFKSGEVYNG